MSSKKKNSNKKTSIGGQALMEGIMMRGPYRTVMCVRRADGSIITEDVPQKEKSIWAKIPIIRGLVSFAGSMTVGNKALMRSAELAIEDEEQVQGESEADESEDEELSPRKLKKKLKKEKKEAKKRAKIDGKIAKLREKYDAEAAARKAEFDACEAKIAEKTERKAAKKSEKKREAYIAEREVQKAAREAEFNKKEKNFKRKTENAAAAYKRGEGGPVMAIMLTIASVLGVGLAVVLFFFLPTWCFEGIMKLLPARWSDYFTSGDIWQSVFEGILKLIIFVIYVKLCTLMKETRRLFEYHGAEHKTIFCYESGEELTVENVRKHKRFHPRCGTSFLIIMLVLGIIAGIFIPRGIFLRPVIKILIIPLIMGVGYELLKLCGRYDNILTKIIAAPGMWMQRLTTSEPDDKQIECAIEAIRQVIPEDGSDQW